MNCLVKILWDWNGTLLNDVDLCFSCINRLLVSHDLKPLDTLSQYREVFTFPIEDYYKRVGFDFDKISFSMLAHEYMEDYQEKDPEALMEMMTKEPEKFKKLEAAYFGA